MTTEYQVGYAEGFESGATEHHKALRRIAALEARCREIETDLAAAEKQGDAAHAACVEYDERVEKLEAALEYYCAQSTIGSPYGADGLKGAIAHHQSYLEYFRRVLDRTQLETASKPAWDCACAERDCPYCGPRRATKGDVNG